MFSILALFACGTDAGPEEASPEVLNACGRVYGSTLSSLEELYANSGSEMPTPVPKAEFAEKCADMGFTSEQLTCLDVKIQSADPSCAETLAPVEDKVAKLQRSLMKKKEK